MVEPRNDPLASASGTIHIRFFGVLHALRRERGLPLHEEMSVPQCGVVASDLAAQLDLPLDHIEGVFCNHKVHPLDTTIRPGDQVAFVPKGTPGPHRYFLGLYAAGRSSEDA